MFCVENGAERVYEYPSTRYLGGSVTLTSMGMVLLSRICLIKGAPARTERIFYILPVNRTLSSSKLPSLPQTTMTAEATTLLLPHRLTETGEWETMSITP